MILAKIGQPCSIANSSSATSTALAPSLRVDAFPAVILPSFWNTLRSSARVSALLFSLIPSSVRISLTPSYVSIFTGTISHSNHPLSLALAALW